MATRSGALAATQGIANFASGYQSDFIAQSILADAYFLTGDPIKTGINYEYAVFDRADGISVPNTETSGNDPVGAILSFGGSKTTGTLKANRATTEWYDASANVTEADLLLQLQGGVKLATQALVTGRFQRIITSVTNAATAGTAITGSNEAVSIIQENLETVQKACGGYCSLRVMFGASAFRLFANNTKVQGRITGGATRAIPATPTEEDVARLLGFNCQVKVTSAVYNSAAPGQTASGAFVLGDSILIAAVSPAPNTQDPAGAKVFEGMGGTSFSPTFEAHGNGMHERASWGWYEKVEIVNSAALRKLAISAA
jgi:hypothetical protein